MERIRGDGREGISRVGSHPDVQNPEKYSDCRTDLIGGGGNIDVCSGRQTPSRRHCVSFDLQNMGLALIYQLPPIKGWTM